MHHWQRRLRGRGCENRQSSENSKLCIRVQGPHHRRWRNAWPIFRPKNEFKSDIKDHLELTNLAIVGTV